MRTFHFIHNFLELNPKSSIVLEVMDPKYHVVMNKISICSGMMMASIQVVYSYPRILVMGSLEYEYEVVIEQVKESMYLCLKHLRAAT